MEAVMEFTDDVESVLDRKGHHVWFIGPDVTVFEAIKFMAEKDIGALVVMDAGELIGIFSERDYTRKVILRDRSSRDTKVREIMTTDVATVEPTCAIEEAMRRMTRYRVRHLPVVADGHVLGVISIGDVVERLISEQRAALVQLEGYIVGRYPG
jgi:CBS domain-containing protein